MSMREEKQHVRAIDLWGYTSGTANLSEDNLEHILFCVECQWVLDQFISALDDLPKVKPSQAA